MRRSVFHQYYNVASLSHRTTDQPAAVKCQNCEDTYCEVCFAAQHRKGSRKTHVAKPLHLSKAATITTNGEVSSTSEEDVVEELASRI